MEKKTLIRRCDVGSCGNRIFLNRPESFTVVNKRRICVRCANNHDIVRQMKGANSYFNTPYHAARSQTLSVENTRKKMRENARKKIEAILL